MPHLQSLCKQDLRTRTFPGVNKWGREAALRKNSTSVHAKELEDLGLLASSGAPRWGAEELGIYDVPGLRFATPRAITAGPVGAQKRQTSPTIELITLAFYFPGIISLNTWPRRSMPVRICASVAPPKLTRISQLGLRRTEFVA